MLAVNRIYHKDCKEGMKQLGDDSMDCCVTDPPYGIRFMGKKWDYAIPSVEVWKEVLRVLKPGAHMLVACGTRTQHRMAVNIEDAGFEIRDVISWHYGSGFPKSMDLSKAIDKAAGADRDIVGKRKHPTLKDGSKIEQQANAAHGDNAWKREWDITAPTTEAAKEWAGWGTGLKPATEFWTLARKRIDAGTVSENVMQFGVGGLNIDACRVSYNGEKPNLGGRAKAKMGGKGYGFDIDGRPEEVNAKGRFPANLILDEFMAGEMDRGTGGASRFFYVAKASGSERGSGNTHPTVKPLALMNYLIRLVCPIESGRIVLEPFAGSGTTCIAALRLGVDFMGFEADKESFRIAERRLKQESGLFQV
jgi:DNA modification methylase